MDSNLAFQTIQEFRKRHPVRKEKTGERNLEFSQYVREKCRPSQRGCVLEGIEIGALNVSDLDFILMDYEHNFLQLLEVKTRNGRYGFPQSQLLEILDKAIRAGASAAHMKYLGLHVLIMDGLQPHDSKRITWDGKPVTAEQAWRKINMLDELDGSDNSVSTGMREHRPY